MVAWRMALLFERHGLLPGDPALGVAEGVQGLPRRPRPSLVSSAAPPRRTLKVLPCEPGSVTHLERSTGLDLNTAPETWGS